MPVDQLSPSFKEMERDGWHQRAGIYDAVAGVLTRDAIDLLLNAVKVQAGMRLLDVCCVPGYGAGKAAERGVTAIGVDIASAMIDEARARFPRIEFRYGDAEQLQFADGSFYAVICPFGLLHLSEPDGGSARPSESSSPEAVTARRYGAHQKSACFSVWR